MLSESQQSAVTVVNDTYSDIDIARNLPKYGPAATAGYSMLTAGMLAFSVGVLGMVTMEIFGNKLENKAMDLALTELKEVEDVKMVVGEPITAFGEKAAGGRGRHGKATGHVQNKVFERDGEHKLPLNRP